MNNQEVKHAVFSTIETGDKLEHEVLIFIEQLLKNSDEVDKLYLEKCEEVNQLKAESLTALEMTYAYATLRHFKKLKEEDRLIELPCPIGTKVYFISCMDREDESVSLSVCSGNFTYSWLDFPRQIFMTKEDAEKKLAESVEK